MFTFEDLQREIGQQNRAKWEELWNALIQSEVRAAGLAAHDVDWDHRVSVADGGRDITIKRGSLIPNQPLIPDAPSIWSVKSGEDGTAASTLAREIKSHNHPKIISCLQSGGKYYYCVCFPASADKRETLSRKALELEAELRLAAGSIVILHTDHLVQHLKRQLGVLKAFCSTMDPSLGYSLEQWSRRARPLFDPSISFVELDGRKPFLNELIEHLTQPVGKPLRHVAGLSGIGKTRLAYEACVRSGLQTSILYYPSYSDVGPMLARLRDNPQLRCTLVVDECSLNDMTLLESQLDAYADRVRAISIGPARTSDRSREHIIVLEPPKDLGVLEFLKSVSNGAVEEKVLERLASASSHDIRFANLLWQVVESDPNLATNFGELVESLSNPRFVFDRVLAMYAPELGNTAEFLDKYRWLTLGREVGHQTPRREELEFLSGLVGIKTLQMDDVINRAKNCGLGEAPAHYFEAIPRGMATLIFSQYLWPIIRNNFRAIMNDAPSEFQRAIMFRVEMCKDAIKREVQSEVDVFFREQLEAQSVNIFVSRSDARLVRAWVELSPEAGLAWLASTITQTSVDTLCEFKGSSGGIFGGTGPRREIIWAVSHLACFDEYYNHCEEVLFRLALAENESIGNNATAEWRQMQRIMLSNMQRPYSQRMTTLLRRMNEATKETASLLLDGWIEAVTWARSADAPPTVIGGRITPEEWRPQTNGEVYRLFVDTIFEGLARISEWSSDLQTIARKRCIPSLEQLCKIDTLSKVKELFRPSNEIVDERIALKAALEELTADLKGKQREGLADFALQCESWIRELTPRTASEFVKTVVARPPWRYSDMSRLYKDEVNQLDENAWQPHYAEAAKRTVAEPYIMDEIETWFVDLTGEAMWAFGEALADQHESSEIARYIGRWLQDGKCRALCCGYCARRRIITGQLPQWVISQLDGDVARQPENVASLTSAIDPSTEGFNRILRCAEAKGANRARVLERLYGHHWSSVLNLNRKAQVLEVLLRRSNVIDAESQRVAVQLLRMYLHGDGAKEIPVLLRNAVLKLLELNGWRESHHAEHIWLDLAKRLATTDSDAVLEMSVARAVAWKDHGWFVERDAIKMLSALATQEPDKVLGKVVKRIESCTSFLALSPQSWQGFFSLFDTQAIVRYLGDIKIEFARRLGQLMPDPSIGENGEVLLPPATNWYLTTFGHDEQCILEFAIGRWNGRVTSGYKWQRTPNVEREMAIYAKHALEGVRRWAKLALEQHLAGAKRDRADYEEMNRRG